MITLLNKNSLYSTFGVNDFDSLEEVVSKMAPSMVEYYLSDLSVSGEAIYLNKRNIQNSIILDEYSLFLDYNYDIYLEIIRGNNDLETSSLW